MNLCRTCCRVASKALLFVTTADAGCVAGEDRGTRMRRVIHGLGRRRVLTSIAALAVTLAAGTWATATPAFAVQFAPQLYKSFAKSTIQQGDTTTLTFDVYNPEPNDPIVNVSFTDNLPAGLVVATPLTTAGPDPQCGGTLTATPGGSTISLTGGSAPAGGFLCSYSIDVTATGAGAKHNVTSPLTADTTNPNDTLPPGNAAEAYLQVLPACTTTVTGPSGRVNASRGTWCITNANVTGGVRVSPGTAVIISGSTISGGISARKPSGFFMCGTTTRSSVSVTASTGFVLVGDPGDDLCPGNSIGGTLSVRNSTAGVEISSNSRIGGSLSLRGNHGAGPFPEDAIPEVEANTIVGAASCSRNSGVTNDGQPNTVGGARSGQCADI